jgi:hypothetical protein
MKQPAKMLLVYLFLSDNCGICRTFVKKNKARYLAYLRSFPNVYQVNIIEADKYDKNFILNLPFYKHKAKPFNHLTGDHLKNYNRYPGTPTIHVININQLNAKEPLFYSLTNCLIKIDDFISWIETVTLLAEQKTIEYKVEEVKEDDRYMYMIGV